jgi:predicted lipoprotein with Yx(FWY)xxD motif
MWASPLVAGLVVTAGMAGCGGSGAVRPGATRDNPHAVTIDTAYMLQVQTRVLVDGAGFALYNFVPDHRRQVTCTGICADSWPPVRIAAGVRPHTGPGVEATLLGTDPNPSGGQVVTYNGWPLYTYADDPQPGIASGQGTDIDGGYWYLLLPNGTPLVPSEDAAPTDVIPPTGTANQ